MSDLVLINSTCVKVCILLALDDNYAYRSPDILFHLALSDFIDQYGEPKSANIRNFNSILHYSKCFNDVLLKMQQYDLIVLDGEFIRKSFSCSSFVNQYRHHQDIEQLYKKMECTHKLYVGSNDVIHLYNGLYDTFIQNKIIGANI